MTIDPELLMAYADGELDALTAKRVERAIAADPVLGGHVQRHRALRARIGGAFATIADEPAPERLTALLRSNVVAMPPPRAKPIAARWRDAAALAACLVLGVSVGLGWRGNDGVVVRDGGLYAAGSLAHGLDTQLAGAGGPVAVALSFRDRAGEYCRVFRANETGGIACHEATGWALRETRAGRGRAGAGRGDYRQAGSADADLMAAAQNMMAGEPLDAAAEDKARAGGWRG